MKKISTFNVYALSLIMLFLLAGCGPTVVYDKEIAINQSWTYDDALLFDIDIQDTAQHYDLLLILDHSAQYKYQNLYVEISTTYPDTKTVVDEVSLQLANSRGEFSGKCGGEKCRVAIVLQEEFKFQSKGKHSIKISQHSRTSNLEGIYGGRLQLIHHEK